MSRTVSEIEALFPSLQTYKTNIRNAIIAQGVDVPSNATVSDYATYILQIVHVIPDSVTITSSTSLTPTYSSTTYTITFTTEGTSEWSIASNQSWCTFNTSSGSTTGSHSVTLTVAANNGTTNRSATITITCGTATGTISVSQSFNTADRSINYIQMTSTSQYFSIAGASVPEAGYYASTAKFMLPSTTSGYVWRAWGKIKSGSSTTSDSLTNGILWKSGYGIAVYYNSDDQLIGKYWYTTFSKNTVCTITQTQNIAQPKLNNANMTVGSNGSTIDYGTFQSGMRVMEHVPSGSKLYSLTIKKSTKIVYNFVPKLHYVNNAWTPCLYDSQNSKYYYVNTGTLNYG